MKAIVYTEYGKPNVLKIKEVPQPICKNDELLIKIIASSVTTGDVNARGFVFVPKGFKFIARLMFGLRKPKKNILGFEFAGTIKAVGKDVKLFKLGDNIFGIDGLGCGAYAEYKCVSEKGTVAKIPKGISYEETAGFPNGALTALYFLRDKGNIQTGHKVLINGASGSVGSAAVQLAKYFGANITGVCSTKNFELVKSLGADNVIDYSKEIIFKGNNVYDIILDTVGNVKFARVKNYLTPNGKLLLVAGGLPQFLQMFWTKFTSKKKVICGGGIESEKKENLVFLCQLLETGKMKAVIDKIYSFEQIVEAHSYVDKGHKKGNVVLSLANL